MEKERPNAVNERVDDDSGVFDIHERVEGLQVKPGRPARPMTAAEIRAARDQKNKDRK